MPLTLSLKDIIDKRFFIRLPSITAEVEVVDVAVHARRMIGDKLVNVISIHTINGLSVNNDIDILLDISGFAIELEMNDMHLTDSDIAVLAGMRMSDENIINIYMIFERSSIMVDKGQSLEEIVTTLQTSLTQNTLSFILLEYYITAWYREDMTLGG